VVIENVQTPRTTTTSSEEAGWAPILDVSIPEKPAVTSSPGWNMAWSIPVIGCIWAAGSVVCLVVAGVRIRRFHQVLDYAWPAPAPMQLEVHSIASRLGLRQCPTVWLVPGRFSPLLWAVGGKARLIIPAGLLEFLRPDQQSALLAHELAHARRHDHWVRWLELGVTCLYWWHPVAWLARRELRLAEEECCDAWVVWALPNAAKAYAKALLQTVDFLDARPALPPVASGIGHVHHLKRRLKMIIRKPFSPRLRWPACLAVVVLGLAVLPLGTDRVFSQAPGQEESEQPPSGARRDDLERRLDKLEQRMDRVLRALEGRGEGRGEGQGKGEGEKQDKIKVRVRTEAGKEAKADTKQSKDKKDTKKERRVEFRVDNLDPQKLKDLQKRIEEAVNRATDSEKIKVLQKRIEESVHRAIDPEKMKDMQKRIEVILNKNLDPERLKALEKEIEDNVHRNFNPERMKDFQKEIEEAVKKGFDPERMKQMGKEIEESVRRSIDEAKHAAEHSQRAAQEHAKAAHEQAKAAQEQAKAARDAEQARRAAREQERKARAEERARARRAEASSRGESKGTERSDRDLERRMQKLEERMDRILQKLDSSKDKDEEEEEDEAP
jgi:beta-lactamase regulating signal transducer with metallopeptidase domain